MKRVMTFDDNERGRKRYVMVHHGFLLGGERQGPTPIETARRLISLGDKIEGAGVLEESEANENPPGIPPYRVASGGCTLELTQPEHELLAAHVKRAPWVMPMMARDFVDVVDWLDAAPRVE